MNVSLKEFCLQMTAFDYDSIDLSALPPETEPARQRYFIARLRRYTEKESARRGRPLTYHVATFGCQMNAHDSEKLRGILKESGFAESDSEQADFVLYNTCTVRENADQRVYGRLGRIGSLKKKHPATKDRQERLSLTNRQPHLERRKASPSGRSSYPCSSWQHWQQAPTFYSSTRALS